MGDVRNEYYLVALDQEAGYCRLFRADSPESAGLAPLWSGYGLRSGYDAMIRLNKERRPTDLFHVCSRAGARGGMAYKVFRGTPAEAGWTVEATEVAYSEARKHLARLVAERDAQRDRGRQRLLKGLRRAGVETSRVPKLTRADLRYIEWLESTGRMAA